MTDGGFLPRSIRSMAAFHVVKTPAMARHEPGSGHPTIMRRLAGR
jgi:hypothetical protein